MSRSLSCYFNTETLCKEDLNIHIMPNLLPTKAFDASKKCSKIFTTLCHGFTIEKTKNVKHNDMSKRNPEVGTLVGGFTKKRSIFCMEKNLAVILLTSQC